MSLTHADNQRAIARETNKLVRTTAAKLAGRTRGPDRQVRRESYDVADHRAQVFTRIADGSRAGGLGWIDDLVQLAEEYDLQYRKPGERGPLMASGVRVLKILCTRFLRFMNGQLDPAVRTVALAAGMTYKAAHAALTRLKKHGFLDWVRRSRRTDNEHEAGPQREQVSNAYHFPLAGWPKAVLQRWRDLRERRRRRATAAHQAIADATAAPAAPGPADPELAATLDRVRALVESANPERGEFTRSGDKG